jgi:hypothetical protein
VQAADCCVYLLKQFIEPSGYMKKAWRKCLLSPS